MNVYLGATLCAFLATPALGAPPQAVRTEVEVRVLARGAKFLGGYAAPVRVVLTDADSGQTLVQGETAGTTGDTRTIMNGASGPGGKRSTLDSAVFRTSLKLERPRRVTLTVTGPLSQPQAMTSASSTQWLLPGRHLTAGDGWLMELPGLIVDVASPVAYEWVVAGTAIPLRASVTMLCGCPIGSDGPWLAKDTDVEAFLTINGGAAQRFAMKFDPGAALFGAQIPTDSPGLYELELRAWMGPSNNAGVMRTAFFVK